jgi:hypothetical protein
LLGLRRGQNALLNQFVEQRILGLRKSGCGEGQSEGYSRKDREKSLASHILQNGTMFKRVHSYRIRMAKEWNLCDDCVTIV